MSWILRNDFYPDREAFREKILALMKSGALKDEAAMHLYRDQAKLKWQEEIERVYSPSSKILKYYEENGLEVFNHRADPYRDRAIPGTFIQLLPK